jgi:hypothetical protein
MACRRRAASVSVRAGRGRRWERRGRPRFGACASAKMRAASCLRTATAWVPRTLASTFVDGFEAKRRCAHDERRGTRVPSVANRMLHGVRCGMRSEGWRHHRDGEYRDRRSLNTSYLTSGADVWTLSFRPTGQDARTSVSGRSSASRSTCTAYTREKHP